MTEEELPTEARADSVAVNESNLFASVSLFTVIAEDDRQEEKVRKWALTACAAAERILGDYRKKKRQQLKLELTPEKAAKGPKAAAG